MIAGLRYLLVSSGGLAVKHPELGANGRRFEPYFEPGPPVKGKKSLNFSTPHTSHVRKKIIDPDASLNESLYLQALDSEKDESCREMTESNMASSYNENISDNKRKRNQCKNVDTISDEEGALMIDVEFPDIAPASKKPRIDMTPSKQLQIDADDDFVITPPPSPEPSAASVSKQQLNDEVRSKHQQQSQQKLRTHKHNEDRLVESYDFERERVHRKIPQGAYFYATNEEGRRVYMQLQSMEVVKQRAANLGRQNSLQLLGTPLHILKRQAEDQPPQLPDGSIPHMPPSTWNVNSITLKGGSRTNNICEGWNNAFEKLVGNAHPIIWRAIDSIWKDQAQVATALLRGLRGESPAKRVTRHTHKLQSKLHNLCTDRYDNSKTVLDLLKGIGHCRCKRLMGEAVRLSEIANRHLEESDCNDVVICDDEEKTNDTDLWVERYKPQKYIDLLSDETTNRTLLKWLKLWDHIVFGRQKKEKQRPSSKAHDAKKIDQNKFHNKNPFQLCDELDNLSRPMHKVALLAGPPGLGKTTMAHIVAQHGGYNVVEMNASDDRSVEVFKQRIEATTQMKAVLGDNPRPNCLIIDEIDGAPQAAINMLLSIIKRGDKDFASTTKRRKKDDSPLLRPIICICNDLYVPALRQLRQQALVITIPQTASPTLASRLLEISRLEQIRTDLSTLLALCEKADNDIRSCLNTLQFAKSQSAQLSLQQVHSMSLGQKDCHKSLFGVWQHIFTMPKPKRKQYINPHDRKTKQDDTENLALAMAANNMTLSSRFHNTLQMALAAGEYQKILQGLHENYLDSKVKDHRMMESGFGSESSSMLPLELKSERRTLPSWDDDIEALRASLNRWLCFPTDWMQFVDILDNKVNYHQDYSLMRYVPYLPVLFHLLFATNHPQKITYPHSQYEVMTKASRNETLVASMITEMAPPVRRHLNVLITVTEVLPPLLSIIQPTLRPINTQLYSTKEKRELAQLVQIMISYNMTYHQERTMEGQYNYVLDPNLDEVVRFPGLKAGRQLTYAAKQLIAQEIRYRRVRLAGRGEARRDGAVIVFPVIIVDDGSGAFFLLASRRRETLFALREEKKPAAQCNLPDVERVKEEQNANDTNKLPNHLMQTLQPKPIVEDRTWRGSAWRGVARPETDTEGLVRRWSRGNYVGVLASGYAPRMANHPGGRDDDNRDDDDDDDRMISAAAFVLSSLLRRRQNRDIR
ncbi:hypothetical protein LSH36_364g03016 [Paralvinella palmiformis]|uniref:AAA+ ATPase domain-containing protein n=1 Tax=Paralvinella palmiformis TaxID=53620 RepID=A0AAD9JEV1_9ANNE|nr:hypothetical protein LSH36_364g03016 [Paralvinella palmiformis]